MTLAVALCAAGAGLAVTAGGQDWVTVRAPDAVVGSSWSLTGTELTGAATALGWAGLAGLAALFAVRGVVRSGLGVLLALFGAGVVYFTLSGRSDARSVAAAKHQSLSLASHVTVATTAWWAVSLLGGALLLAAGLLTAVRGAGWAGMSSKYDRDAAPRRAGDPVGMWKALDRGEDPTGDR
jgi:uncharacterized membrane protein (TIGR02234 family)